MEAIQKHKIRLNKTQEGIIRTDGVISDSYDKDFYVTISIIEDISISEYVDIEIEGVETSRECIPLDGVWRDSQLEDIVLECLEL